MKKRILSFLVIIAVVCSFAPAAGAMTTRSSYCANSLYALGLFKGTGVYPDGSPVYDLDRAPTREEAIVMLVRLLGKEKQALYGEWSMPFTDVEDWAKPYVGYAWASGLTKGTGQKTFGGGDSITASQYITFVLRALGYNSDMDFNWDSAWTLSDTIGLTNGAYRDDTAFLRSDVAVISYNALSQSLKSGSTLLAYLYGNGVVTSDAISDVGLTSLLGSSLAPSEIYSKCASAVFYISVYDKDGRPLGQASGFFIDSNGTAVTNYHVIENAYSARIKMTDGNIYNVLGVYSCDAINDLALIKVDGSGFPYLETGDANSISTGTTVYTIGNPLGLESSISQGIVSYFHREIGNTPYVQITAPISPGSSGGALLDASGKVIGVTTGGYTSGQSLNLAVPIDCLLSLSRTSLSKFGKVIPVGKETSYAANPTVPDFGAYFGRNLYTSRSYSSSDYSYTYVMPTSVSNPIAIYHSLLEKWGYKYNSVYTSNTFNGDYYSKDNVTVLVATRNVDGTDYALIAVYYTTDSKYPKKEIGTETFNSVPDFAEYFGIKNFTHTPTSSGYSDRFSISEVYAVDGDAVSVYLKLLEKWGFTFSKGSTANGTTTYCYTKNSISVTLERTNTYITINLSTVSLSTPAAGSY